MRPHILLRAVLLAGVFAFAPAAMADTKAAPPIADFFGNTSFNGALLSPSGKYLAVKMGLKDQYERLAVIDLATNTTKVVGNFADADIGTFTWVNDQRLAFTAAERDVAFGEMRYAPGVFAVNRDGTGYRQLAMRSGTPFITVNTAGLRPTELLPWHTYLLDQRGPQDSDVLYLQDKHISGPGQLDFTDLIRLNTVTGRIVGSVPRPGDSKAWLLDAQGEPRLSTTVKDGVNTLHYRDPATQQWRELVSFDTYAGGKGAFRPLAFGPDGTLYVVSNNHKNTSAVYAYDLKTNQIAGQPLVILDGYDFHGSLIMDKDKLLGVRHLTDAWGTTWLDPAMKAVQAEIDAKLPNTVNLVTLPSRPEAPWVLVTAFADIWPSRTLIYNKDTKQLSNIGESRPAIDPNQMARKTLVNYQARDGLEIPAWLTVPKGGGKKLPMVVLIHGGPFQRGERWDWSASSQFLASRGYVVLEPEFRGSTGYGTKLFRAGWKQWGLKMQDDIADGTRWAVAQGIADGKRVCVGGYDYGGYATLMGLINDPDLYKCGFEWAGPTDIELLYNGHWNYVSDLPATWKQYGMPQLVGDRVKDAEQFKATSPLQQAARIRQPLLLAYGGADQRVPLPHGSKFYDAVKQTNPQVEWIEYSDEGHGWKLAKTRIDFWGRVEKFLDKNIGDGAAH